MKDPGCKARAFFFGIQLERQAQSELDVAALIWNACEQFMRWRHTSPCQYLAGKNVRSQRIEEQVGVIEQVEELGAELKSHALSRELEVLQQRGVEVPIPRCAEVRIPAQERRARREKVICLCADWVARDARSRISTTELVQRFQ